MMNSDENALFITDEKIPFETIASFGKGSLLLSGFRIKKDGNDELALNFFIKSSSMEAGRYGKRAAKLAVEMMIEKQDYHSLLNFVRSSNCENSMSKDNRLMYELIALVNSESWHSANKVAETLQKDFPESEIIKTDIFLINSIKAKYYSNNKNWIAELGTFAALTDVTNKAIQDLYDFIENSKEVRGKTALEQLETSLLAQLNKNAFYSRYYSSIKEYGKAIVYARKYALTLKDIDISSTLEDVKIENVISNSQSINSINSKVFAKALGFMPNEVLSFIAKSLISSSQDEGSNSFNELINNIEENPNSFDDSKKYYSYFWNGRFLLKAEKKEEAIKSFKKSLEFVNNYDIKADYSAWYICEASFSDSVEKGSEHLASYIKNTKTPDWYSDIIEQYSREALTKRKGKDLLLLDRSIEEGATLSDKARMSYIVAVCILENIITQKDYSAVYPNTELKINEFATSKLQYASTSKAYAWYSILSAYRLGKNPVSPLTVPNSIENSVYLDDEDSVFANEYANALCDAGLTSIVRKELNNDLSRLKPETITRAAKIISDSGMPDEAYRMIVPLFWRNGFVPSRNEAVIYWPCPYKDLFEKYSNENEINPYLLYSIARSESIFDADVSSYAGAIGIIQLMPETAKEQAARMKLTDYDLTNPNDNLAIGSAFFARLLKSFKGNILSSVCSYNAGPARYRRWEKSIGKLPPDLFIEAITYKETRNYGRNVLASSIMYAALYGQDDIRTFIDSIVK